MLHYNATVWCWTILWLIWLHQPNKLWGKIHMQKPLIQYNYHLNNDYQNGNQNEERHQHQHPHHHHHHHQQHNHSPNHHYRHYPHYFHQQYHHRKHQSEEQAEQQKQQQQEQHIYQLSDYDLVEMTATTTTTTDINDIVSPRLIDEEEGVNLEGDPKIESTQLNVNNNDNSQEFTMRVASAKHHQQKSLQQQEQQQHNGNVVTTTASATYPYATTIPLSHSNNSQSNTARIISTIQVEAETQINPHRDSNLDGREGIINLYALTDKKAQLTPRLKSKKTAAATTTTPTSTATANSIQTPDFAMTKHASSNSLKYQQQQQQQLQEKEEEEREIKENGERIGESKEQEKQLEEEQVRYNYNSNNNNNNNNNNDNINNNNHNDNQNNNNSNTAKSFLARHTKFNLNTLNGHYRHHHHRQHHQHTHQHHQQQQQHHHQSHELLLKKDSARDQTEYGGRQLEQNQNHNQDEDELDDTDADADADTEADDYYEEDDEYAFRHNHDNDNDNDNDNDTEIHDDNNDIDDNNNNDDDIDDDDENMLDQIDKDNGSSSSNNKKNKNEISNNNDNNNNSSPSVDTVLNDDDNLSDRSYTRITRSRLDYDYADDEPQYHNTIVDDFRERERDRDRNSNIDGVPSPPGVITEQKYSEVGNEKAVQQARERYVQQHENNKRPRTPHELATDHWHRMIVATKCRKPMPRVIPVSNNTSKRYEPYATILYRCGEDTGCCGSTASVCTVKRYDIVMVYVFSYDFNYRKEIEALPMHNHTECHCVNRGNLIVHDTSSPRGKRSGQNYKSQHQHQHQYQYQQRQQQQQQHQHQSQQLKLWAQSTDKRWRRSDVISNLLHQHHHQQQHLQQKEQQLSQHCNYTNFNCLCPQHFHHFEEEVERHAHLPQSHDIITHKCHCDCLPKDYLCERYKRGEELLNREDRKCINDGCCKPPTCLHGDYNIKLGKCPSIHRTTIENYPKILPYQSHHHNHRKQHQSQSTTSQDRSHLIKLDLN